MSVWFVIACAVVLAFNAYVADVLTRIRADLVVVRRAVAAPKPENDDAKVLAASTKAGAGDAKAAGQGEQDK